MIANPYSAARTVQVAAEHFPDVKNSVKRTLNNAQDSLRNPTSALNENHIKPMTDTAKKIAVTSVQVGGAVATNGFVATVGAVAGGGALGYLGGAIGGAAAGSVLGPIGMAAGGLVGGIGAIVWLNSNN